jgi:predicted small lipoprotein YifL
MQKHRTRVVAAALLAVSLAALGLAGPVQACRQAKSA